MRTSTVPPRSSSGGSSTPGSPAPGSSTTGEASDERDNETAPRSSAVTAGTAAGLVVAVIAVASTTLEQQDSAEAAEFTSAVPTTSVSPTEPLESLLDTDASEDETEALAEAEERVDPTAREGRTSEGMATPGDMAAPRDMASPGDLSASEMARASRRPPDSDDPMEARLAEEPPILDTLVDAAEGKDVDPELVVAVAWHESRWDQGAVSNAGALGVMQVLRPTAEAMAEKTGRSLDPRDPADNATAGSAYLARLLDRYDDVEVALVAYNQGPSALDADGPYPGAEDFAEDVLETREQLREVDW